MRSTRVSRSVRGLCDSEGKGLFGCLAFLVLLGVAIYLGITLGPIYYSNFNFESNVKTEASRAGARSFDDQTIVKEILEMAKRNEIQLTAKDIFIERFAGQVHITVHYAVPVDFVFFARNMSFQIKASSFTGAL